MRFGCLAVFIAALSTSAMAIEDSRVPGGVAVIPIEPDSRPTFDGKPVLTITDNGQDLAVVGLPLSLEPGTHQLQNMGKQIPFEVRPKKYLEQRIYLKNQRHVTPNPLDLDRIKGESKRQRGALDAFDGELDTIRLILPVEGPISGPFGKRRFFNDQPRRPHSGTDINLVHLSNYIFCVNEYNQAIQLQQFQQIDYVYTNMNYLFYNLLHQ